MNTERYLKWLKLPDDSDQYIFRNLIKCKSGFILRHDNKALSYARLRELFIEAFKPHVPDFSKYGLQSLRERGPQLPQIARYQNVFMVGGGVKMRRTGTFKMN